MKRFVALIILLFASAVALAQPVVLSLSDTTVWRGDTISIPVRIGTTTGRNILAYQFRIYYPAAQMMSIAPYVDATGTLSSGWSVVQSHDSLQGKIAIAGYGTAPLAGSGVLVNVRFRLLPTAAGASYPITLTNAILNEGNPACTTTSASITILAVELSSNYTSLSFGNVALNHDSIRTLQLINSGNGATTVRAINATGAFTVSGFTLPLEIPANSSRTISVHCVPTIVGSRTGTLTVQADRVPNLNVALSATGVLTVPVSLPDTTGLRGDTLYVPVRVGSLNGGNVLSYTLSLTYDPTRLRMVSPYYLSNGTLSNGGSIFQNHNDTTGTLRLVGFHTTALVDSGTLIKLCFAITATAPPGTTPLTFSQAMLNEGNPATQITSGSVLVRAVTYAVSPATMDFGAVRTTADSTQTMLLSNTGNLTANITSISGSGDYTIVSPTFPTTLPGGNTLPITVRFHPSTIGTRNGTITVTTANAALYTVPATGSGFLPTLAVQYPNGGEQLPFDTTITVRWSVSQIPGNVELQYNSSYPSTNWQTIATLPTSTTQYTWSLPFVHSSNCRMRVRSLTFPEWIDSSNANFSIIIPPLRFLHPTAGDTLFVERPDTVRWIGSTTDSMAIGFTRNGELSNVEFLSLNIPAGTRSYIWTPTLPATNNGRIYIGSYDGNDLLSDAFVVVGATIHLNYPTTAQTLYAGLTDTIRWSGINLSGGVKVELNRTYPTGTWETLIANAPNTGSFVWTTNGPASTAARYRISSVAYPTVQEIASINSIIVMPTVALTYPNATDTLYTGLTDTIRWTSNFIGNATVKINTAYPGTNWTTLANNVALSAGKLAYNGSTASSTVRFAIIANLLTSVSDTSDANVRILTRNITVIAPNGGDSLRIGIPTTISWTALGTATVSIGISYAGAVPESLVTIASNLSATTRSYNWTPTGRTGSNVKIRIRDANGIEDWSNANFVVVQPSVRLTYPNSGELLYLNERDTIRWQALNLTGRVKLEINRTYPSASWTLLDSNATAASGQYIWNPINGTTSSTVRLRISYTQYSFIRDTCDVNFSIVQRSISLTAPNGGDTLRVGLPYTIRYTGNYLSKGIKIELNRNDTLSTSWETLIDSVSGASTSWDWLVSGALSSRCRIRVSSRNLGSYSYTDRSDNLFHIQPQTNLYVTNNPCSFAGVKPYRTDSLLVTIANRSNLQFRLLTLSGPTSDKFTTRLVSNDSLATVNDSIRVWVSFAPDSTIAYRDTLRFTFESPYQPVTVPLYGLGLGYYVTLSSNSMNFPTELEPTRRDSLTIKVFVKGNQNLTNGQFYITPSGVPFRIVPATPVTISTGDSLAFKLYYEPLTPGYSSAILNWVSDAVNIDTIQLAVTGSSNYVPSKPGNLRIAVARPNLTLTWNRVDTSTGGVPLTPDFYLVYAKPNLTDQWGFLTALDGTGATSYTHSMIVSIRRYNFYMVTAWIGTTASSDAAREQLRKLPVGTSEAEVEHRLSELEYIPLRTPAQK